MTNTTTDDRHDFHVWERAEAERSEVEASLTPRESLDADEGNVRRYLNPPADTLFHLEYAFHLLGDVRSKSVLDFGCGSGENTLLLARRGARVTGMDLSPSLIELAKERMRRNRLAACATFSVGSAHEMDLPPASFDVVFGIAILHHLSLDVAAGEVWRVLKPGGRAIFQEPVRNSRLLRTARRLIPYRQADVSEFERPLTDAELRQFSSRFSVGRTRVFSLPFINAAQVVWGWRRPLRGLRQLDAAILRTFPATGHFAGIRVFELTK